ncbi:rhodanese-like domain-containing protein, partial [Neobacillus drentensis]
MKQMTAKEVEELLNQGKNLNIIDVREVKEVAAGKIPGAVNISLGLLEFRMHELDKS